MKNEQDAKLKTFALMIKFSHDLFDEKDLQSIGACAVNNSHALLGFRSSALFRQYENKKSYLLGQFGQTTVTEHSYNVQLQKDLLGKARFDQNNIFIPSGTDLPEELAENNTAYILCKLSAPESVRSFDGAYIWLLEYEKEIPENALPTIRLLGKSIAEAMTFAELAAVQSKWKNRFFLGKWAKILSLFLLFTACMFIPVRESATAEFMLKASQIKAAYASFDALAMQCLKQDGAFVRQGESIVRFDTEELDYRLANAVAELKEVEADLVLAQQEAFTDESKLGKVKLLQARSDILKVAVKEAKWRLKYSVLKAPSSGILALAEGRGELLEGKAVRRGEKLFEIYGGKGMIGEIMVHERDSSILHGKFDVELFLHTAPEKAIACRILSIGEYPILNEQKSYCYPIRVLLPEEEEKSLRYGMRGIAKLAGKKVSLGYYLFKSMILYLRKW